MDGTFTVPYITYDAYGRVTGKTNRTITLPAAPTSVSSATTASSTTSTPNMVTAYMLEMGGSGASSSGCSINGYRVTIPSGGTWRYLWFGLSNGGCGDIAGGQTITANVNSRGLIAVRIS